MSPILKNMIPSIDLEGMFLDVVIHIAPCFLLFLFHLFPVLERDLDLGAVGDDLAFFQ